MLPPKDVYSVVLHNHTTKEVTVNLTYTNGMENTSEDATFVVAPQGTVTAEQRTFKKDSAEFTTTITSVQVVGESAMLTAPFPYVDSPTKNYAITIAERSGVIALEGTHP